MIHQILVISPTGLCVVDRCYEDLQADPQLISGFLSAVIPRMEQMGYTLEKLHAEMSDNNDGYIEVNSSYNWITVGFANQEVKREKLHKILTQVSQITHQELGSPKDYVDFEADRIDRISQQIDVTIAQTGIPTKSVHFTDSQGILPIVNQVIEGNMKPKKAAKLILKAIEEENFDENELDNIKTSLKYIDQLLPDTTQLDDLQVVLKATYQGVSKLTVRLDNELMF